MDSSDIKPEGTGSECRLTMCQSLLGKRIFVTRSQTASVSGQKFRCRSRESMKATEQIVSSSQRWMRPKANIAENPG
jgi:hypothetical protein